MIKFKCSHCGQTLQVRDEACGKKVKCKICAEAVLVPAAKAAKPAKSTDAEEIVEVEDLLADDEAESDIPVVPRRKLPPRVRPEAAPRRRSERQEPNPAFEMLTRFGPIVAALVVVVVLFFKAKNDPRIAGAISANAFLVGLALIVGSYLWGLNIATDIERIGVLGYFYYLLPLGRLFGVSQGIRLVLAYKEHMRGPSRMFWIGFILLLFGGVIGLTQVNWDAH